MKTVSIASGSKGNCLFVGTDKTKILVDDGLSFSVLKNRLLEAGEDAYKIDAVLLTHEHSDHIGGLKTFLNKNKNAKVYIPVFVQGFNLLPVLQLPQNQIVWFKNSTFFIKDATISCFILPHDSHFCVGYSIISDNKKVSIATDLGCVSRQILDNLKQSDVLFFESNHDVDLLKKNPKYSARLKKRILSGQGHLSNVDSALAICELAKSGVKQVVLSHLSEENNTPSLAYKTAKEILLKNGIEEGRNIFIDVAYQGKIGTIFEF